MIKSALLKDLIRPEYPEMLSGNVSGYSERARPRKIIPSWHSEPTGDILSEKHIEIAMILSVKVI